MATLSGDTAVETEEMQLEHLRDMITCRKLTLMAGMNCALLCDGTRRDTPASSERRAGAAPASLEVTELLERALAETCQSDRSRHWAST